MLWDICFLYSLAGTDTEAKGCLLPRAPVLPVTKAWPQHAACSRLPSARLGSQEFGCEAKASQRWLPLPGTGCGEREGSAQPRPDPHSAAEPLELEPHVLRPGEAVQTEGAGEESCVRPSFQAVT